MLDITDLKVSVRNFLLAQSGITSLVGQQVYFTNLFTLHNPTYPIVNIEQFEGRNLVPAVDRIGLNVFCSSKISYDESDGIWTAVNNVLNNAVFSGNIIMRLQII